MRAKEGLTEGLFITIPSVVSVDEHDKFHADCILHFPVSDVPLGPLEATRLILYFSSTCLVGRIEQVWTWTETGCLNQSLSFTDFPRAKILDALAS